MNGTIRKVVQLDPTWGEHSRTAKLTEAMVLELRRTRPQSLERWREEQGLQVSLETLRAAMYSRTWRHLPPMETKG